MRLEGLTAVAHPDGNRVVLTWRNPDPSTFPGVRVVRREGAYPETPVPGTPAEGAVVADSDPAAGAPHPVEPRPDGSLRVVDDGLTSEASYCYALFPYSGSPPAYQFHLANRAAAVATGPYDFAGHMYRLLPAVYHRFDRDLGQLRRFLDLPGGQLDQLYSAARSLPGLSDVQQTDGRLLPLLATWIGWRTDHRLGFGRQRTEIRDAPAIYHTIENVATVEATVRRIANWGSRTKEFVDNVFVSNRPERRNLWLGTREGGAWTFAAEPLSIDPAYDGRPAAVRDAAGTLHLFYHTHKGAGSELWHKTHLDGGAWTGSEPVVRRSSVVERHPAAAVQGGTLWLFWEAYVPATGGWRVDFRTRTADRWSPILTLATGPGDLTPRRSPAAVVDDAGALWLFWQERVGSRWRLRHQRFTGVPWVPDPGGAFDFPDDGGADPRVEADLFVAFRPSQASDPTDPFRKLWVFWARQDPVAGSPEQTRWRVVSRFKDGTDPSDPTDWGAIATAPRDDDDEHDREPAARVAAGGDLEVFWSSNRAGGWSLVAADLDAAAHTWAAAVAVTSPPHSARGPLPLLLDGRVAVAFRSNRPLSYHSAAYRATETVDRRYAGSTTAHTRDAPKIALRGELDDFAAYTYDAGPPSGRTDADWYARDTVGLYVEPGTLDPTAVAMGQARLRSVLPEFVPATDRAVLIVRGAAHVDFVYGYEREQADAGVPTVVADVLVDSSS